MVKTQENLKHEEQKILDQLIQDMDDELLKLNNKLSYESLKARKAKEKCLPDVYGDLISAEANKADTKDAMKNLSRSRNELYERRLIVDIADKDSLFPEETEIKVGLHTYTHAGKVFIMSWKMPVCRSFTINNSLVDYDGVVEDRDGSKYTTHFHLKLKRQVEIVFDRVKNVTHYYPEEEMENVIADEFLQELLKRRSESEFKNIVFSIQKHQGEIIQTPFSSNLIVQGCAGSGKSMIMLHRLPVLMYDNPNTLNQTNLYIITPSMAYMQQVESMRIDLEIEKLKMGTLEQYYDHVIQKYSCESGIYGTINPSLKLSPEIEKYIYSEQCAEDIDVNIKAKIDQIKIDYSDGYALLGIQEEKYGGQTKTKSEEVRSEIVSIQKIINENNRILRQYLREIKILVAQLDELARFLRTRKRSLTRAIDRMISTEYIRITNAQEEMLLINKKKHDIKYQNRINTIQVAQRKVDDYMETREIIDLDEDYFESLKDEAHKIQKIVQIFADSKRDPTDISFKSLYQMIENKVFLCNSCDSIQKMLKQFDDPYRDYVEGWKPIAQKVADSSEKLSRNTKNFLSYDYLTILEGTNSHLLKLNDEIVNNVYTEFIETIMGKMKWETKQKGHRIALNCSPYLYLRILYAYYGAPQGLRESLISIDEAQNLAPEELHLLRGVNHNRVVLNLFGDINQHVESEKGIDSWNEMKEVTHFQSFDMSENYRNARQITQYCNKRFHLNMRAINLDGRGVHEIKSQKDFVSMLTTVLQNTQNHGLSCILVKNTEEADTISKMFHELRFKIHNITREWLEISSNKWNLMTVEQVKGLEFGTVFALSGRMSMNEKYIAYTRALDELYVFDHELPLINQEDYPSDVIDTKSKIRLDSKNTEIKSERKKRNKRKMTGSKTINHEPDLKRFLEESGLSVIDKRSSGGVLWVVGNQEEIGNIINAAVKKYDISGSFGSGKATNYKAGWYTKTKK